MFRPLTSDDFPLMAAGACVYRKTESSPMFTAPNMEMARDLVARLNRDDQANPTEAPRPMVPCTCPGGAHAISCPNFPF